MIEGTLLLICQTVILAFGRPCVISTPHATIHADQKAVVFVDTRVPETTAIYSLHEHNPHDVLVQVGDTCVHLAPARAMFITKQDIEKFEDVPGKLDFVQYFNTHRVGRNIWMTNFVLPTLIATEPEFRKLLDSEDKEDQKVLDQILKTAVILKHYLPETPESPPNAQIGKHCTP